MKKIILSLILLSPGFTGFLNASLPKQQESTQKKFQCVSAQALGKNLAALTTFNFPSAGALSDPSYAFESKEKAIEAGWQFKKQTFHRGELVIVPEKYLASNPCKDKEPMFIGLKTIYIYSLCLGMHDQNPLIQRFFDSRGHGSEYHSEQFSSDQVGKLPENDLEQK